ncbi:MAG: glutamyl-tRNA reductase [Halofilum sp. (in: g-proteobacteria)]|nr:glutamyl-tRNA reductase [Halofilum sp. (in: g-proteobacteria)]
MGVALVGRQHQPALGGLQCELVPPGVEGNPRRALGQARVTAGACRGHVALEGRLEIAPSTGEVGHQQRVQVLARETGRLLAQFALRRRRFLCGAFVGVQLAITGRGCGVVRLRLRGIRRFRLRLRRAGHAGAAGHYRGGEHDCRELANLDHVTWFRFAPCQRLKTGNIPPAFDRAAGGCHRRGNGRESRVCLPEPHSMSLLALGLNHTTAPVEIRERVVFEPTSLQHALAGLTALPDVREAAIVSTCNRTEIYCSLGDAPGDDRALLDWFHQWHGIDRERIEPCMYRHRDRDAIRHLLRVASGLDSMILGEPQIAGQLKEAWRTAQAAETLGQELGRLFQHAFTVAKEVRTETGIGVNPVSVAFAAVTLARQIFGDLDDRGALMIGAGETIELAARHLSAAGIGNLVVANRDPQRSLHVAEPFGGRGIALSQLPEVLHEADIVISSTASTLPILGKGAVEQALKRRRHRPMFMVDIAVPRDIEPEIGTLDDVFLYSVDDLQGVIEDNMSARRAAAAEAETIIEERVEAFVTWQRSLGAVDTIREFRDQADDIRSRTLEQARQALEQGRSPEEALEYLADTLTGRLIHNPTVAIRRAGEEEREELLAAARALFDLDGNGR